MEHTSTTKFANVHEQIIRVQQHVLDIQGDVQRDEATFAQINQAYQQVDFIKYSFEFSFYKRILLRNYTMQLFVNIFDHFH